MKYTVCMAEEAAQEFAKSYCNENKARFLELGWCVGNVVVYNVLDDELDNGTPYARFSIGSTGLPFHLVDEGRNEVFTDTLLNIEAFDKLASVPENSKFFHGGIEALRNELEKAFNAIHVQPWFNAS